MGEWFTCVTFVNANLSWRAIVPALQKVFILFRACTERDEERTCLQDWFSELANQVIAFLRYQPRDDGDDGTIQIFRHVETTQQIAFALALAGQICGREMGCGVRIGFRVPQFIINAIRDAHQSSLARPQYPIKSGSLFRSLYFIRIAAAYSRQCIGCD